MEGGQWVPPWLYYQHIARYEWARQYCSGRVLDAACGTGYGSATLRGSSSVVSLDLALEALAEARQTIAGLRLLIGDMTRLPFRSGAFDTFISFETIEHVPDDRAYVTEARRVLRSGGTFICSTPNRRVVNPGNTILDRPFNKFHVREYDQDELQSLLGRSFSEISFLGQSGFGKRYVGALRMIGRRWRMAGVRLHQIRKLAGMPLERRSRHEPRTTASSEEPEVLIAICR